MLRCALRAARRTGPRMSVRRPPAPAGARAPGSSRATAARPARASATPSSPARRCSATTSGPPDRRATTCTSWPSTITVLAVAGWPSPRVLACSSSGRIPTRTRAPGAASRTTRPTPRRAPRDVHHEPAAVALQRPLEVVHVADEVGHERGGGRVVDLAGRAELVDPALVHDRDAVGHGHRLLLVVRDHDEGDADVALDRLELDLHGLAELQVQRAERLVEQQHLRAA